MANTQECRWCGVYHGPHCPLVKAVEYFDNGMVKRVGFLTTRDYHLYPLPANQTPVSVGWGLDIHRCS